LLSNVYHVAIPKLAKGTPQLLSNVAGIQKLARGPNPVAKLCCHSKIRKRTKSSYQAMSQFRN
jgi:hypothetical protein